MKIVDLQSLKMFLERYRSADEEEEAERQSFRQFVDAYGNKVFDRENLVGHFSSSCWIVNKERNKVLMIYHNMFKTWAWVGGHSDREADLLAVALRETKEETSLKEVSALVDEPIDLNVMVVHNHYKRGVFVPRHLHYNVVYCLEADETEELMSKPDENSGVLWISFDEVKDYCADDGVLPYYNRIMKKIRNAKW